MARTQVISRFKQPSKRVRLARSRLPKVRSMLAYTELRDKLRGEKK